MRIRLNGWIFGILLVFLFLEILITYPTRLETESADDDDAPAAVAVGEDGEPLPTPTPGVASQKMQGVHLVESRAGARDWELFAKVAEGVEGKGSWELQDVKVLFYSKEALQFTVVGKAGTVDTKTKDISIFGDVQTTSTNGYKFFTDRCNYEDANRFLRSPEKVRMFGPKDKSGQAITLTGDRMEMSVNTNDMTISDNVIAKRKLSDGRLATIRSENAEFSNSSKKARFYGKVSIDVDTMKLEGPDAVFAYDPATDYLSNILVSGGVHVSDVDKFATSESVNFLTAKNEFILAGKPRLVQNNDEITGDRIVFVDGGKKVKVENIRGKMDKQ